MNFNRIVGAYSGKKTKRRDKRQCPHCFWLGGYTVVAVTRNARKTVVTRQCDACYFKWDVKSHYDL